jgi:AcrR family transcriptional regulator
MVLTSTMLCVTAVTDHRGRLLAGMAAAVREQGFAKTTLADVVRHAGVSRRTFYEHFTDPVDCYLALIETVGDAMLAGVAEAMSADAPLHDRLDRAVGVYLEMFAADPEVSRSYWTETEVTGERGRALVVRMSRRTGDLLHALAEDARARDPSLRAFPPDAGIFIAAGVRELALLAYEAGQPLDDVRATAVALLERILGLSALR